MVNEEMFVKRKIAELEEYIGKQQIELMAYRLLWKKICQNAGVTDNGDD